MTSVFVAFIPAGTSTIQQIAFGLAVGVFVDAFVVRMTLVPAVLMLLGDKAWWLPSWLATRMPVVDVEGAALHRKIAFERLGVRARRDDVARARPGRARGDAAHPCGRSAWTGHHRPGAGGRAPR